MDETPARRETSGGPGAVEVEDKSGSSGSARSVTC